MATWVWVSSGREVKLVRNLTSGKPGTKPELGGVIKEKTRFSWKEGHGTGRSFVVKK